jgi:hypothetical protein
MIDRLVHHAEVIAPQGRQLPAQEPRPRSHRTDHNRELIHRRRVHFQPSQRGPFSAVVDTLGVESGVLLVSEGGGRGTAAARLCPSYWGDGVDNASSERGACCYPHPRGPCDVPHRLRGRLGAVV